MDKIGGSYKAMKTMNQVNNFGDNMRKKAKSIGDSTDINDEEALMETPTRSKSGADDPSSGKKSKSLRASFNSKRERAKSEGDDSSIRDIEKA